MFRFTQKLSLRVLASIIAMATLSACASIPEYSDVYYGATIEDDTNSQFIRVIARPPSANMSPEALVRGFLDASADPTNDFEIARKYLSVSQAKTWNPATGISVYDSTNLQISTAEDKVTMTSRLDSTISDAGHLTISEPGRGLNASFKLQRDADNQWRIDSVADGLLLARGDIDRSFRSFPVYFLDPNSATLVPDAVMVRLGSNGTATALVKALLNGPSPNVSPAVRNAIPSGTRLTYGSVPIVSGVASVDLSAEVLGANESVRRELSAQMTWTLSSLPDVNSVQISVSGQPLAVRGMENEQTINDWSTYTPLGVSADTDLHVIRDNSVVSIAQEAGDLVETVAAKTNAQPILSGAVSRDGRYIAVTTADGNSVLSNSANGKSLRTVITGESLSRPTWDAFKNLYVADYGTGVFSYTKTGKVAEALVDSSEVGDSTQIRQIMIAPDGVRVVLVFANGTRDVLALGYLMQTNSGPRIVGVHRIENQITSVLDVVWTLSASLSVLGGDGSGGQQLFSVSINDGRVTSTTAPVGAQSLAVDTTKDLVIGVSAGDKPATFHQVSGAWVAFVDGGSPFYRG